MQRNGVVITLVLGAAVSLLAASIAIFVKVASIWAGLLFSVATALLVVHAVALIRWVKILDQVGIKKLEPDISTGTNTQTCIRLSQRTLKFLGIASSKWLTDQSALRLMLLRHAGSGGHADFLLLDPTSEACREFEAIKKRKQGSLAEVIRSNAEYLLSLRNDHFRVNVRFYSDHPRFRLVIIDNSTIMVGLYSYVSEVGDDSPQLVLDGSMRPWSYYYAFNALFTHLWERSVPAEFVLGPAKENK